MSRIQLSVPSDVERWLAQQAASEGFDDVAAFLRHAVEAAFGDASDTDAAIDARALAAIRRFDAGEGIVLDDEYWSRREARLANLRTRFGRA